MGMTNTERDKLLIENSVRLAKIELAIVGNGAPGLHDRLHKVECDIEPLKQGYKISKWILYVVIVLIGIPILLSSILGKPPQKIFTKITQNEQVQK